MKPSRIDKVTSDEASRLLPGRRWRRRDRRGARPPSCALQAGTVGPRPRSRNSLVTRKLVPALFIALAAAVAVPGCGGGGGGVKPEPPPCIPTHSGTCLSPAEIRAAAAPLAEDYRRQENVANQWGLRDVGAHWAYAHLDLIEGEDAKPGAGVTIGFIDSGIDRHQPMFAGATISETFLLGASDETGGGFDSDDYSHGTAVASIAAGRPTNRAGAPQGVAWAAEHRRGDRIHRPDGPRRLRHRHLSADHQHVRSACPGTARRQGHTAPFGLATSARRARSSLARRAGGPDEGGRDRSKPGFGGPCAEWTADRHRSAVALAAGRR